MLSLVDLPSELIHQIVSPLAAHEAPSRQVLYEEPRQSLLGSTHRPLKNISRTSRFLRHLCFPYLFSALKASVQDLAKMIAFARACEIVEKVESLLIHSDSSIEPSWSSLLDGAQVLDVLDAINPRTVTFVLPPVVFEAILPYTLDLVDAWAFDLPYQVLRLERGLGVMHSGSVSDSSLSRNIFTIRPWSHVIFNEGSSVSAYSTYEYFHKRTPSLLVPRDNSMFPVDLSAHLTSLDIIAIFPMAHALSICAFISNMKNLRRLRTQLAPSVNNRIMDDPKRLGRCQRADLWAEFEYAYQTISDAIGNGELQGEFNKLQEFVVLDWAILGLRDMILTSISLNLWKWQHDGEGSWTRSADI